MEPYLESLKPLGSGGLFLSPCSIGFLESFLLAPLAGYLQMFHFQVADFLVQ